MHPKVRVALRAASSLLGFHTWTDPPLPLPAGRDVGEMRDLIGSIRVDGAPEAEMAGYWDEAFGRFLRTLALTRGLRGRALELGANPYFLTVLVSEFTELELTLANYFGDGRSSATQTVSFRRPGANDETVRTFTSQLFDAENAPFPFPDATFDVVFFCEILEHMTHDPLTVIREINRVLRPGGQLILTTPNVGRIETVARVILGDNPYSHYSGYGPHGRHNREYTPHEVDQLLRYAGFAVEERFTADSHPPRPHHRIVAAKTRGIGRARAAELGQYTFVRARRVDGGRAKRPTFLYTSYPEGELEDFR
jgi:SAM-dependent methyltransferase